ncbi:MAG: ABC transporter ATP-binding protein [Chloroflexi bacterium]|nr:ABC transporter ATP-binding protein [Ardenticatenaceae bacterium]MBL1130217.1 ABC transporter ATP-binding protein [Chloroflexota bacterium]NOG36308.1 ABC transporter ATP-binding protein [Chloroflexota bacterium]GIK58360.1 MAG: multidrug ABC transporter ATP-binding protein [Chloroflexota bacterium]
MMNPIIEVKNLQKAYGRTIAVADVSLTVQPGEIFGIVGPNGAGKTTTIECIIGLRQPDGGSVSVLGMNPQAEPKKLGNRIGVQLQEAALPDRMKVWEALDLYASFYERPVPWEPLLETWGLADKQQAQFGNLSGGQKQRLFIALALLNDPEVVFLDELTTGLDPQARRATWDLVRAIREKGKTVVLITHFMDEIEALADRVAIIDHGRVLALDTPAHLIAQLHGETQVYFTTPNGFTADVLRGVAGVTAVSQNHQQVTVTGGGPLLANVAAALAQNNIAPHDLRVQQANLEDVFLALTGRNIRV